jgi:P27 family predicted phage terminase small subunit
MNVNTILPRAKPIKKASKPPQNLKKAGRQLWESIIRSFNLEQHDLVLLHALCECVDRKDQAEKELNKYGSLTFRIKKAGAGRGKEELKPHPCVAIVRDCCSTMARLRRELGLSEPAEESRPPRMPRR